MEIMQILKQLVNPQIQKDIDKMIQTDLDTQKQLEKEHDELEAIEAGIDEKLKEMEEQAQPNSRFV